MRSSPEFDLIAAIRDRLGGRAGRPEVRIGIGDDAAVVEEPGGGGRAVSVDAVVDGVAFRRNWCPPRAIGRKAAGAALSDLAAMGAEPAELYVWLGVPEDFPRDDALELCDGLADLAESTGAVLLGGDLTGARVLSGAVTAIGRTSAPGDMVGRAGAEPGDAVCVTGTLGGAAAGLMLLEHPELAEGIPGGAADAARARQLEPRPQIAAGRALAAAGATAMIDVSDGLLADLGHVARASGVTIELDLAAFEIPDVLRDVSAATGRDPHTLVLTGGEDHALAACFPSETDVPEGWRTIGRTRDVAEDEDEEAGVLVDGAVWVGAAGWDHFGGTR